MELGYQVGQIVNRGSVGLQQRWQNHLEQFRTSRDAGFDIYCWAHHYLINPFQHFQPWPVLARLAGEAGQMKLATSVLLLPLLNPVEVAGEVATLAHLSEGRFILGLGLGYRPEECAEQVARYRELGVTHVSLRLFYPGMAPKEELRHIGSVGKKLRPVIHAF